MIDHTAEHDPLCRGTYQRFTPVEHCASCDLIHRVRLDMMDFNDGLDAAIEAVWEVVAKQTQAMMLLHWDDVIKQIESKRQ